MINVLIVDDHRMFAESLARLFETEPDLRVVDTAFTATEALADLEKPETPAIDVCVLDHHLPDREGASLVAELRAKQPDLRVVMLTGVNRPSTAQAALAAGCDAFITKDRAAGELADTVRAVHAGRTSLDSDVRTALQPSSQSALTFGLTNREREVLQRMADGAGTATIAADFVVSNNTVRTHVQRIITKLGAHSKLEAVAIAREAGLV